MSNSELSDTFTTLLNSYNTQAGFGEQTSKRDIVLDEYEKSVLLTQAQDIVVKSYFDSTLNNQKQGFDDSTRRQVDFSSLIKVTDLTTTSSPRQGKFDERGIIYKLDADVLFILNEKLIFSAAAASEGYWWKGANTVSAPYTDAGAHEVSSSYDTIEEAEVDGWQYVPGYSAGRKEFVVVPINYKEYDREMSKPYAQPLKKQAWRLFQNQDAGFDINTEIIPKHTIPTNDLSKLIYRIRYIRRPQPIILETLPNNLEIDGQSVASSCELNPIIHMDILNKAVELAIATRGGAAAERGVPVNNNMMGQNN